MKLSDIPIGQLVDICNAHSCCDDCQLLKDNVCMLSNPFTHKDVEVKINAED